MSRPHYGGWNDLLKVLSGRLSIPLDAAIDPIAQAERFYKGNEAEYRHHLAEIYGPMPTVCRPSLCELVKLDFAGILTTNFEYSIYYAFSKNGGPSPNCHRYPTLSVSLVQKPREIFFIHGAPVNGAISDLDHIVLHETSYRKAYFDASGAGKGPLMVFLFDVFNQNDAVFIGYGLGKDEPLQYALRAAAGSLGANYKRMMLAAEPVSESDRDLYMLKFGIELVPYDPLDSNHSGLDEVINYVSSLRVPAPPPFKSPLDSINASDWRNTS